MFIRVNCLKQVFFSLTILKQGVQRVKIYALRSLLLFVLDLYFRGWGWGFPSKMIFVLMMLLTLIRQFFSKKKKKFYNLIKRCGDSLLFVTMWRLLLKLNELCSLCKQQLKDNRNHILWPSSDKNEKHLVA